ncbi:MAG: PmoA family protein [Kiritimatiellae bacterium]|nr:PmoA family protein [Kiritimatiellia bacterium]
MKKSVFAVAAIAASCVLAAPPPQNFAADVEAYLAAHKVAGVDSFQSLLKIMGEPCGAAAPIDATVQPKHRARKVRLWGARLLPVYKSWGLDVAEFDPEAAAQGDLPDVVVIIGDTGPDYSKGLVDAMFRAAAEGVHVVSLCPTDRWSDAIAKRLGFKYDGVLTIGPAEKGGALIPNCPKLFEGFPAKTCLNAEFGAISKWQHGMYLTFDKCLMCVADAGQGRIASAIAQYPVGRGAVTLVGPSLRDTPDDPACKRLLLNLICLLPPAPKALKLPFIYHPVPPEGKPYFELRVPGSRNEYVTAARPPDHLWHPALFFSWKKINGRSFWEPRRDGAANRVVSHGETPTADGAVFESELAYEVDGHAILRERRTVKATVNPDGGYSLDWTGRFEALEDLSFSVDKPEWNKANGTANGGGYAGLSMRLAGNADFEFSCTNSLGNANTRCMGDLSPRIDVYAKSKRTGETTRVSFIADRPVHNYALFQPERNANAGFYFVCFAEAFKGGFKMKKGERRELHYVVEVGKEMEKNNACAAPRRPVKNVSFVELDPGHFHAALVLNRSYDGVSRDVAVFAPEGPDVEAHRRLVAAFNAREKDPTAWNETIYTGADYFAKALAVPNPGEKVVVLAGKNDKKADYYLAAIKAGFNVLSDKPMAITPDAFAKLKEAARLAEEKGLYFADIMTERNEITTILQRALVASKDLYGEQEKGTPDDPAVTKVSVHHFCKLVNGKPLQRPGWYYDTDQQGEAIVDVTTHLVDLVQWETFPGETLKCSDVKMIGARTWPTPISAADYKTSTGLDKWPDFLKKDVDGENVLQCKANGEFTYSLRGVHAKVSVEWHFMPPEGTGDTHYSLMRGTKSEIIIRQGREEGYKPRVYVQPRAGQDKAALEKSLRSAVAEFNKLYPGVSFEPAAEGWRMVVPKKYEIGHEAHFSQVMNMYLGWMRKGVQPADYLPNMLVKYHTLAEAWKASRAQGK